VFGRNVMGVWATSFHQFSVLFARRYAPEGDTVLIPEFAIEEIMGASRHID